ncbi:hypothetical protein FGADI_3573 [Fusarium gaditjirri]|uniref:Uncharacterized protein n=1 Tax=Fusarium gaditjirri TaxID=282569 RepID=A0A8H4X0S7_9HYPO|nr:hypothetical protein FGADI_3573 [Fusarium gaditjirri]
MRFYASFSLAFGLVAASPCKPLTTGSTAVSATFSSATEISSTFAESATSTAETLATDTLTVIESETSTALDTTVTEASTFVGSASTETTDVTISASETSSQATSDTTLFPSVTFADTTTTASTETTAVETSADTTTTGTTETSNAETSAATTTTVETSTAVTTTTTSEEPGPTDHLLIAGQGSAQGLPLKSTNTNGDFIIFGDRTSRWTVGRFVVDPTTGHLTRDGIPVCAKYQYMNRNAALTPCSAEYNVYGTAYLTCARNPAPGTALQCSAVKLDCVASGPGDSQTCTVSTEAPWTKFFVATSSDYTVYLGADDLSSPYYAPVDIFIDRAPTAAAPTAP